MNMLSRSELTLLTAKPAGPAISIYMPSHRSGEQQQQEPIRLRNLLKQAEEKLLTQGLRTPEARQMLKPAQALLDDPLFWQHQANGLALFISAESFCYYNVPYNFDELVVLNERFHIKPLVPMFTGDGMFYILALSQDRVRLLQCTRFSSCEITPEKMPHSLADTLKYDDIEKQPRLEKKGGAAGTLAYFSQYDEHYKKTSILRYFQEIDKGLHEVLKQEQAPLVMAGVDFLQPIYRQANSYAHLLEKGIEGNPDLLSDAELHKKAWPIVEEQFLKDLREGVERYGAARNRERATADIIQGVLAAFDGRVDMMFFDREAKQFGTFDPQQREIIFCQQGSAHSQDLINLAATHTLLNNGAVYALEKNSVPEKAALAAILRW